MQEFRGQRRKTLPGGRLNTVCIWRRAHTEGRHRAARCWGAPDGRMGRRCPAAARRAAHRPPHVAGARRHGWRPEAGRNTRQAPPEAVVRPTNDSTDQRWVGTRRGAPHEHLCRRRGSSRHTGRRRRHVRPPVGRCSARRPRRRGHPADGCLHTGRRHACSTRRLGRRGRRLPAEAHRLWKATQEALRSGRSTRRHRRWAAGGCLRSTRPREGSRQALPAAGTPASRPVEGSWPEEGSSRADNLAVGFRSIPPAAAQQVGSIRQAVGTQRAAGLQASSAAEPWSQGSSCGSAFGWPA
mmetsp:Transcript_33207/g.94428  ORF Transcript_33207/g.94428 Transcript_33207/m.94428 type:complete len:297 (-) Transcript_33207:691-1581(-)